MRKIKVTISLPVRTVDFLEDLAVKTFGKRSVSKFIEWYLFYKIDDQAFLRWMAKYHAAMMYHYREVADTFLLQQKESAPRTPPKKIEVEK